MEAWREELYHSGKPRRSGRYPWGSGDRPYQSETAGFRLKKKVKAAGAIAGKVVAPTIKGGKDKPNISPAEKTIRNVRDISSTVYGAKKRKLSKQYAEEASSMSNEELRRSIERMNLEDTYVNKKSSRYIDGKTSALDILDTIGDVTSIAAAIAGIGSVIYKVYKDKD